MGNKGRVFLTGDTHRGFDRVEDFCSRIETTKDDVLVILGDNGVNWYGDRRDEDLKAMLQGFPITFFMIRGNHDMRPREPLYRTETVIRDVVAGEFYIQDEYPDLLFAKDGNSYLLDDKSCFVIGGAFSIDRKLRLEDAKEFISFCSWHSDEQLNANERIEVTKRFAQYVTNRKDPIILSHTCPMRHRPTECFLSGYSDSDADNSMERWLDTIENMAGRNYKWFCGHWHTDKKEPDSGFRFMFKDFEIL